ncbi:hypothetical protein [Bradyrhizobium stylosanthis]|uniref:Uncharacterized protein n=1 Tax=Bradyrhizobium stylosanthis TaxID=1803665 RepID=A0A560D1W5_9BRAD|nr:hypothetical protein [Bradyrhizobium stylosanthis]TWA91099.1 hypothetical protein FBZ96_11497 [Bradyrhizobium stylosanthis]
MDASASNAFRFSVRYSIGYADTADDATHAALGVIGIDLGPAHEAPSGAAQVVKLPLLHRRPALHLADPGDDPVEFFLCFAEPTEGLRAIELAVQCRG